MTDALVLFSKEQKTAAREALSKALDRKQITKPAGCSNCGDTPKPWRLHGHHDDYSKPLEVRWLCVTCHTMHHSRDVTSRARSRCP